MDDMDQGLKDKEERSNASRALKGADPTLAISDFLHLPSGQRKRGGKVRNCRQPGMLSLGTARGRCKQESDGRTCGVDKRRVHFRCETPISFRKSLNFQVVSTCLVLFDLPMRLEQTQREPRPCSFPVVALQTAV